MKHYIELTLLPNPNIKAFTLWSKTYQQLHLALVEIQDENRRVPIGLSFPEYLMGEKFGVLGGKLRVFSADEAGLVRLDIGKWLNRLSDYVHHTGIRPVPEKLNGYATYRRLQPKTGKERLARRYAKRHRLDFETALNKPVEMSVKAEQGGSGKALLCYGDLPQTQINAPFIRLKSLSSDQPFYLWIEKTVVDQPVAGNFNSYGLSPLTTVPEF